MPAPGAGLPGVVPGVGLPGVVPGVGLVGEVPGLDGWLPGAPGVWPGAPCGDGGSAGFTVAGEGGVPSSRAPGCPGWVGAGRLGVGVVGRSPGAVVGGVVRPGVVVSDGVVSSRGLHAGIATRNAPMQSKTKSLFIGFSPFQMQRV